MTAMGTTLADPRLLPLGWGRMAFVDTGGNGLPVLFLPGTSCYIDDWAPMLAHLPATMRRIPLDFRGHGRSDAPMKSMTIDDLADDAIALIDHLRLDRVMLVGHSLGGMVGMLVAQRCEKVAGLVLLEGWSSNRAFEAYSRGRVYGTLTKSQVDDIERRDRETVGRVPPHVWKMISDDCSRFDGVNYLTTARIPIWEVYGTMGRTAQTQAMLDVPPNPMIRWVWIDGAGHYLPHEKPREVAAVCEIAWRELSQESPS